MTALDVAFWITLILVTNLAWLVIEIRAHQTPTAGGRGSSPALDKPVQEVAAVEDWRSPAATEFPCVYCTLGRHHACLHDTVDRITCPCATHAHQKAHA